MCIAVGLTVTAQMRSLPVLEVWGRRPLKEVGVERTTFDSVAMRENVAQSMADILAYNSGLFVKNYGRATLSTVSFRGTSPSHTQVTWNGMRINNPMLGMTDFSTIPSFFVDKASLLHGSSSVTETGGALGGVVQLGSTAIQPSDSATRYLQYVQGVGSFRTFDEFARFDMTAGRWSTSTRVSFASSPNDYPYTNHDKKVNIYDENHNIIGQYHPRERNRSGRYADLHVMEQVGFDAGHSGRFGLDVWYVNSDRHLPVLTTDYGEEREFVNRQREQTLRAVLTWRRSTQEWNVNASAGYAYTQMAYDYRRELAEGVWAEMTRSRSYVNTAYLRGEATWYVSPKWLLTANISAHQHFVRSHDRNAGTAGAAAALVGYNRSRLELSGAVSAKWQPVMAVGLSAVLREEAYGDKTAFIPAFFADAMLWEPANLMVRGSVSSNHKFPSLNDLYFMPGGNPDLRDEKGVTWDAGLSAARNGTAPLPFVARLSAGWFDSHIDDWIIWLPTPKGFFSPRNVKTVHAYGVETNASVDVQLSRSLTAAINASYSWTPSINCGEPVSPADQSVGKQLPYVPRHSAALTGRITWRTWSVLYKWAYYSRRYTMSSNDITLSGRLPQYFMNNVSVQKDFTFRPVDLQVKVAVNNLFNEDYLSVLSRPMPGINFEVFLTVIPRL